MDKTFAAWLAQDIFTVLVTPIDEEQRLKATRQFVAAFVDKTERMSRHERQQVVDLLRQWQRQKAIAGKQLSNDKETGSSGVPVGGPRCRRARD